MSSAGVLQPRAGDCNDHHLVLRFVDFPASAPAGESCGRGRSQYPFELRKAVAFVQTASSSGRALPPLARIAPQDLTAVRRLLELDAAAHGDAVRSARLVHPKRERGVRSRDRRRLRAMRWGGEGRSPQRRCIR